LGNLSDLTIEKNEFRDMENENDSYYGIKINGLSELTTEDELGDLIII